jgi:hypothetical protein
VEGLEVQLHLNASGDDFVNNPLNFRRVQVRVRPWLPWVKAMPMQLLDTVGQCTFVLHMNSTWDAHGTDLPRHSWLQA